MPNGDEEDHASITAVAVEMQDVVAPEEPPDVVLTREHTDILVQQRQLLLNILRGEHQDFLTYTAIPDLKKSLNDFLAPVLESKEDAPVPRDCLSFFSRRHVSEISLKDKAIALQKLIQHIFNPDIIIDPTGQTENGLSAEENTFILTQLRTLLDPERTSRCACFRSRRQLQDSVANKIISFLADKTDIINLSLQGEHFTAEARIELVIFIFACCYFPMHFYQALKKNIHHSSQNTSYQHFDTPLAHFFGMQDSVFPAILQLIQTLKNHAQDASLAMINDLLIPIFETQKDAAENYYHTISQPELHCYLPPLHPSDIYKTLESKIKEARELMAESVIERMETTDAPPNRSLLRRLCSGFCHS